MGSKYEVKDTGVVDFKQKGTEQLVLEQGNSDPSGILGQIFYRTDTNELRIHNGANFQPITAAAGGWQDTGVVVKLTTNTDQVQFGDGSVGTPSLSFENEPATGFYRSATGTIKYSANGVEILQINAVGLEMRDAAAILRIADGSAALPGISFNADNDTGMYRPATDQLTLVAGGVNQFNLTSTELRNNPAETISIGTIGNQFSRAYMGFGTEALPSFAFGADADTGMYRQAGNVLAFSTNATTRWVVTSAGDWGTQDQNKVLCGDGTAASPGYQFNSDNDTGMYRVGADQLGFSADGSQELTIDDVNGVNAVNFLRTANGTASLPGFAFTSDNDTGIYRVGEDDFALTAGGSNIARIINSTVDRLQMENAAVIFNVDGTSALPSYTFGLDTGTGMYRPASNILGFVTGGVEQIRLVGSALRPTTDNTESLGVAVIARWADVNSVLINGADYGFANGYVMREWPCTYEDVQTKSPDWMKQNANKGIQILNDTGEQICVIGRDGTVYAKSFKTLEELPA